MVNRKKTPPHPLAPFTTDFRACRELAQQVGCSAWHIMNIRDRRREPSFRLAMRLRDVTGLSIEALAPKDISR